MKIFTLNENNELYVEFLDYCKLRVSKGGFETIKHLTYSVISWFEERNISLKDASITNAMEFKKYLNEPVNKKLCIGSIRNHLKMGRKLFNYLVVTGRRDTNPFLEIKYPRLPDVLSRNILNELQMNRLFDAIFDTKELKTRREKLECYRLHVVSVFLYSTGMRIAEAASILPKDIDVKRREVIIRNGKGGKSRIAFLSGYASDVLDYYLRYGRDILLKRCFRKYPQRLFGTDTAALAVAVNSGLSKICKKLEIPVITCHGFRHSLGTHLLRQGCDMRYIQLILGHEKLNSTQRYIRVDRRELRNIIDMYHPRKKPQRRICI